MLSSGPGSVESVESKRKERSGKRERLNRGRRKKKRRKGKRRRKRKRMKKGGLKWRPKKERYSSLKYVS